MNVMTVAWVYGVYAILLVVGGWIGRAKAGSQASWIAGVSSAALMLLATVLMLQNGGRVPGLVVGMVVALGLAGFFGARFARSRKVMPGGMMAVVSLVVGVVAVVALLGNNTGG